MRGRDRLTNKDNHYPRAMEYAPDSDEIIIDAAIYFVNSSDKLSGGEKQRVAVARALISKCKVLLGDEVTSALDNQTERNLLVTLQKAKVELGLTIVVIAHRLSTVINADNIVCMEHGRGIVEQGTHAQLMENNGLYKQFYMAQKMKETLHQGNKKL
ncbi:unnamed protein product [Didymodactylos carnosus]|uniref:ABC transporter domain-containing protein n=1 Tax=Didymodactylos carnosus TaxID=1234261 RepID=A0A815QEV1_9BILA|nr:unnamed protein product [Didymodactylos carnosus]CAF4332159.1 unnamed protein product [Didymodactylos carnosus]